MSIGQIEIQSHKFRQFFQNRQQIYLPSNLLTGTDILYLVIPIVTPGAISPYMTHCVLSFTYSSKEGILHYFWSP
ncbi:MAG: hypothetical protein WD599_04975, partial [Balneolaceae bacterium]